jgi:LmbE family N-acetylglucosaminyl deacetylase
MQYLPAAFVLAPLSVFLWVFFLRQKKTARIVRETIPGFNIRLSHSGGIVENLTLPASRISCGFSPDYDIDLTHYIKAGHTTGKAPVEELGFQLADGRLAVTAHRKVMLNGVERTSGSIPVNGSVLFKTCRFTFLGQAEIQKEHHVFLDASALRKWAAAPAALSLAAIILLTLGLVDLGFSGFFQIPVPRPTIAIERKTQAEATTPAPLPDPESPALVWPGLDAPVPTLPRPEVPAQTIPVPTPEPAPETALVLERKPVVVPLRSAVRPEPIKPVPDRSTAPVAEKKTVVVPLRSAVRPEPIKPVPERSTAPVAEKKTVVVPLRSAVRPEPIKPVPDRSTAPVAEKKTVVVPPRVETRPEAGQRPTPLLEPRLIPSPYPAPRMVGPGEPIPEERIDVLFIHAHPDDESIDFGTLMSLCSEAGLTTAMVLLTDGEGGIYQQDYTGPRDNMIATRIQEATRAMQYLGSSLYIRLGLRNNPYNSLLEEMGVEEVLRLWGTDAVVARLAEIINTLGPKVVVSPEGPSFAREHFEHETTGVLTLMALQHLRLTGGHVPEAHMVSVDPRQKEAYTGLIGFPRQRVMERQRQALLSHATQADATYFGVQIIENYHKEYYLIRYWDMAIHFSNFFEIAAGQPPSTPGNEGPFLAYDGSEESKP